LHITSSHALCTRGQQAKADFGHCASNETTGVTNYQAAQKMNLGADLGVKADFTSLKIHLTLCFHW